MTDDEHRQLGLPRTCHWQRSRRPLTLVLAMSGRIACRRGAAAACAAGLAIFLAAVGVRAQQGSGASACTISGRITGLDAPVPGVVVAARRGDTVQAVTSSALDGTYRLRLPPATYRLTIDCLLYTSDAADE